MLRKAFPITTRRENPNFNGRQTFVRRTCLLCRILWPTIVQHRHLAEESLIARQDHKSADPVNA